MLRVNGFNGVAILTLLLLITTILVSAASAKAAELVVPDQYPTIQEAVDVAGSGDTITIRSGTYGPFVVEGKDLAIQGEGEVIVTGTIEVETAFEGRTTTIVFLKDASVTMEGLWIRGAWGLTSAEAAKTAQYGIIAQESDLEFTDGSISIGAPQGPVIMSWSQVDGERPKLKVEGAETPEWANSLIHVTGDVEAEILNNNFTEFCGGVQFEDEATGVIAGNTMVDSGCTPIGITTEGKVEIRDNTIIRGWDGAIVISGDGEVQISNNTIKDTYQWGGIYIQGSAGLSVNAVGNTIVGNSIGILLGWTAESAQVSIRGNTLQGNGSGIYAYQAGSVAQILENEIRGNGAGVFIRDEARVALHYNNIMGNYQGLNATKARYRVDAKNNWWGDPSGPSGAGLGAGDEAVGNVDFDPWLREEFKA